MPGVKPKLSLKRKKRILAAAGANTSTVKMILELEKLTSKIQKADPGLAGAWGAGCGGVTC